MSLVLLAPAAALWVFVTAAMQLGQRDLALKLTRDLEETIVEIWD